MNIRFVQDSSIATDSKLTSIGNKFRRHICGYAHLDVGYIPSSRIQSQKTLMEHSAVNANPESPVYSSKKLLFSHNPTKKLLKQKKSSFTSSFTERISSFSKKEQELLQLIAVNNQNFRNCITQLKNNDLAQEICEKILILIKYKSVNGLKKILNLEC